MLYDNHGRQLKYLRLAVTDRCNLRCFYCMPEEGLNFNKRSELLTFEEMERLVVILANLGISKVRITGGEPFVRKDMIPFMKSLSKIEGISSLNVTTNGTNMVEYIDDIVEMGINSVNLSLDSLDRDRFFKITRRDIFDTVMQGYQLLVKSGLRTKINMVVMEEHNLADIIPMCELTKSDNVAVRFIEEMPFNGGSKGYTPIKWNFNKILNVIKSQYVDLIKLEDSKGSTSYNYKIPDAKGSLGIIPAYTRTICGQCDRIRITPKGDLKTCLYDSGVFSFRDFMRKNVTDEDINEKFLELFQKRAKDGFEAEKLQKHTTTNFESMATIGG